MAQPPTPQNFEDALSRLEVIIKLMETHDLPLEDMLVRYEEGINLVKFCGGKLDHAEQRIKIISEDSQGKPELIDFESADGPVSPASSAAAPPLPAKPVPRPIKAAKPSAIEDGDAADEVGLF